MWWEILAIAGLFALVGAGAVWAVKKVMDPDE